MVYISIVKDGSGVGNISFHEKNTSVVNTSQYILPKENVDLSFIYYLLQTINLDKYKTGSTIPHIYFKDYSIEKVLNFEFTDWVTQKNEKRKNKEIITNTCRICGSSISKNAELCVFCYNREKAQNSKRISREDLKKEILLVRNGETSFL